MTPPPAPVPAFPFDTTRNGILFVAVVTLASNLLQAAVHAAVARRQKRTDDAVAAREATAHELRRLLVAVQNALSDRSTARRAAFIRACDDLRDFANIDLGGPGTERLRTRVAEFLGGIHALEVQVGPADPLDPAARSLIEDLRSSIYAYARGWRVPRRLRGRPGLLGRHRRAPDGLSPPVDPPKSDKSVNH